MGGWISKACVVIAAFVALTATPVLAQAPPEFSRELSQRLAEAGRVANEGGYMRAAGPFAGGLATQQSRRYTLTLRAGHDYRVIAVCESRCGDIDLRLFNPHGNQLTQDTLNDNVATLAIHPASTGPHAIEVDMYQCTASPDPCYYALGIYTR